ncbi:AraC-like DNA-binding protein [Parabacteroides sp. PFB2-10]|uniref:helix-turn-helix domain-containing protein n=1 Tax=Parabacteroides sp. PFB2-10 TaxID=1742405 RepID=UPI0024755FC4|nr:AraC family transcriptional regulator [Parabacteroides sp. PFB2-10]MDH6314129.1 AraC-like DNA-binding protein [Parabacteroides sp. PFB2-10]MDL2245169.1 AraC family transcriptional regulator [Parabacteroides sp. OttesenSCG-928-J18]
MELLYPKEHFSCYNYEKGQNARLEILKREAGTKIIRDLVDTEIVFVIDGHFTLSYSKFIDMDITKGKILFFPPGSHVEANVLEDTHIIICRVRGVVQLCECLNLEQLHREYGSKKGNGFHMLDINERIYSYIEHFVDCVNDGLKCSYYFGTKMKELFFLLRAYYTKEELAAFFAPILGKDSQFMNLMYQNYRNVKSVQELANLSMYSPSGFKKQFGRVFGTSASEWLSDQKAALIFQDLNNSPLSIKELADKYGFSSVSAFSNFCLAKFGKPPGKIRQKTTDKEENSEK